MGMLFGLAGFVLELKFSLTYYDQTRLGFSASNQIFELGGERACLMREAFSALPCCARLEPSILTQPLFLSHMVRRPSWDIQSSPQKHFFRASHAIAGSAANPSIYLRAACLREEIQVKIVCHLYFIWCCLRTGHILCTALAFCLYLCPGRHLDWA